MFVQGSFTSSGGGISIRAQPQLNRVAVVDIFGASLFMCSTAANRSIGYMLVVDGGGTMGCWVGRLKSFPILAQNNLLLFAGSQYFLYSLPFARVVVAWAYY